MRAFRKATSMMSPSRVRPLIIQRGKENCPLLFGKGGGVGKRALPILPPVSFRAILLKGRGPSLPPPASKPPLRFLKRSFSPPGPTALRLTLSSPAIPTRGVIPDRRTAAPSSTIFRPPSGPQLRAPPVRYETD